MSVWTTGVERALFVRTDRRVRPFLRCTLRPIGSPNLTPRKPLWAGAAAYPYCFVARKAGLDIEAAPPRYRTASRSGRSGFITNFDCSAAESDHFLMPRMAPLANVFNRCAEAL